MASNTGPLDSSTVVALNIGIFWSELLGGIVVLVAYVVRSSNSSFNKYSTVCHGDFWLLISQLLFDETVFSADARLGRSRPQSAACCAQSTPSTHTTFAGTIIRTSVCHRSMSSLQKRPFGHISSCGSRRSPKCQATQSGAVPNSEVSPCRSHRYDPVHR